MLPNTTYSTDFDPERVDWFAIIHKESINILEARFKGDAAIRPSWESDKELALSASTAVRQAQ